MLKQYVLYSLRRRGRASKKEITHAEIERPQKPQKSPSKFQKKKTQTTKIEYYDVKRKNIKGLRLKSQSIDIYITLNERTRNMQCKITCDASYVYIRAIYIYRRKKNCLLSPCSVDAFSQTLQPRHVDDSCGDGYENADKRTDDTYRTANFHLWTFTHTKFDDYD